MGIEESGLFDIIVEDASEEEAFEECPCCGAEHWLRAIACYIKGACWVIYCAGCGKPVQKRWNIIP